MRVGPDLRQLLTEFVLMCFESGYSVAAPDALMLWEAQFGDFINEVQLWT